MSMLRLLGTISSHRFVDCVWGQVHKRGPWVPRYVTTGCTAVLGRGLARAMLVKAMSVEKREARQTMMKNFVD